MKKLFILIITVLILAGCEPTEFGMPQSQFNQLSNKQKQQVIANYNAQQAQREKERPFFDALGAVVAGADAHKTIPTGSSFSGSQHSYDTGLQGGCTQNGNSRSCRYSEHSSSSSSSKSSKSSVHFGVE